VLPGTPEAFPIGEAELIEKAKKVFAAASGVEDPSLLADSFRRAPAPALLCRRPPCAVHGLLGA
jgi:hypothetical protein